MKNELSVSNGDSNTWEWRGGDFSLGDDANIDIPDYLLSQDEDLSFMFDDEGATPVKSYGDLPYQFSSCGNNDKEPSSQVKRRRMLEFGSEGLGSLCNEEPSSASMNSKEDENFKSEISQWVSGFADMPASGNENLDQSPERWISDCFNDVEMQFSPENPGVSADAASDVQLDTAGFCNKALGSGSNVIQQHHPVKTRRNIIIKGRKSHMQSPKVTSSVVYPFDFVKPCGVHGDVTLNDINQRISTPPLPKKNESTSVLYPTSAFSGKPVVGKTKIRTEGGKGSITIMRTKG
nr:protein XRI1-like [Ipomoea batatas]GMD80507.1 protein XRI1-like [Ipomoea batatas]